MHMNGIHKRKEDHIQINLKKEVNSGITTGFERYSFIHAALPEINLEKIKTHTSFLGFDLQAPILISSMTGGTSNGDRINLNLAEAAQKMGIAMGIGSQRAAIEKGDGKNTAKIRKIAPTIPLFANLGAVQLNYGFSLDECKRAVELVEADGLILHLNPLQEALQEEGETDFSGLARKIEMVCTKIDVPVIVKEVGWGISEKIAINLMNLGVAAIDVAGAGGTSWSEVEKYRTKNEALFRIATQFRNWGIPTAEAVRQVHGALPTTPIVASGGLRRGMELAKAIALGASIGGFAGALIKAADESAKCVTSIIEEIELELRITMFAAGVSDIDSLSKLSLLCVED